MTTSNTILVETATSHKLITMPRPFETIDELLKSHASEPQDIPLVGYPELELTDFKEHTAKELDIYTDAAVASYMKAGLNPAVTTSKLHLSTLCKTSNDKNRIPPKKRRPL